MTTTQEMNPGEVYELLSEAQSVAGDVTLTLNRGEIVTGKVAQFTWSGDVIIADRRIHASAISHISLSWQE